MSIEDQYTESTKQHDGYIPGACNISGPEVTRRAFSAWVHCALVLMFATMVFSTHVDHLWRFVVGVPAFFAGLGFLQAGTRFCAGYGLTGYENMSGVTKAHKKVWAAEARKQDKIRSIQLILAAFFIAVCVAMIAFIAPIP